MVKLVEHWAHHNEEHAKSYRTWAERARHMGLGEIGRVLEKVAAETLAQNTHFEKILGLLQGEAKE